MKERDSITAIADWLGLRSPLADIVMHIGSRLYVLADLCALQLLLSSQSKFQVLLICVHYSCSSQASSYFRSIRETYGMDPRVQHYGCLVDLAVMNLVLKLKK